VKKYDDVNHVPLVESNHVPMAESNSNTDSEVADPSTSSSEPDIITEGTVLSDEAHVPMQSLSASKEEKVNIVIFLYKNS
jgi:hypothetical protein